MSGKALLGNLVHALGANLHLYPLSLTRHHRGVKSLIAVGLGMVDPVAQTVWMTLIDLVESNVDAEALVDFVLRIRWFEDDAYGEDVVDLVEGDMLVLHLRPDGVRTLDPGLDGIFDAHVIKGLADRCREVVKDSVALFLGERQLIDNGSILLGMLIAEAQVFKFRLDLVQSQSVGNGRIDIERFSRNLVLLVGRL